MDWKRVFRAAVCLLVICCLVINCSPIRANALVVEAAAVTGVGVFSVLFAISMGIVAVDLTAQLINGMGKSMQQHVESYYEGDDSTSDTVTGFFSDLSYSFGDFGGNTGNNSGPEQPDNGLNLVPIVMLDGLIDWAESLIDGDRIEIEGEAGSEGYWNYNGIVARPYPQEVDLSQYPYIIIGYISTEGPRCLFSSKPLKVVSSSTSYSVLWNFACDSDTDVLYYSFTDSTQKGWNLSFSRVLSAGDTINFNDPFDDFQSVRKNLWSNYDIYGTANFNYGQLLLAGTDPVFYGKKVLTPIYVGDIPQQVQDGSFDEDKFELPYINYTQLFQGQTDPVVALNNIATQLQEQTMTYEQYMEQILTEVTNNPEPEPEPEPEPDPDPSLPGNGIISGLQSFFVPADGFVDAKLNDLTSEFAFANSIALTVKDLRSFLLNLGSNPPVIYIDLGASTGSYNLGGKMVLVDFSFYEPYKPMMDSILSAFLWLWFVWRVALGLPGIISGVSGVPGSRFDASNAGVIGSIFAPSLDEKLVSEKAAVHKPHPGSTSHFNEWLRNRNDAHYKEQHGGK